jgi:hypothetical protein
VPCNAAIYSSMQWFVFALRVLQLMIHPIRDFKKLLVAFGIATRRSWTHGATSLYGATRCITSRSHLHFFSNRKKRRWTRRQCALSDTGTMDRTTGRRTTIWPWSATKERRKELSSRDIDVYHFSQIDGFNCNITFLVVQWVGLLIQE